MSSDVGGTSTRGRIARGALELLVIFIGVTAAFFVDGRREQLDRAGHLAEARRGILAELDRYSVRAVFHADSIDAYFAAWRADQAAGSRTAPQFYRIPGATHPPTAAWDAAVASGVVNFFEPEIRVQLGYFYKEFLGIHDNYVRNLHFIERDVLPRQHRGATEFYDATGRLEPEIATYMMLHQEFADDLRELAAAATTLKARVEADAKRR